MTVEMIDYADYGFVGHARRYHVGPLWVDLEFERHGRPGLSGACLAVGEIAFSIGEAHPDGVGACSTRIPRVRAYNNVNDMRRRCIGVDLGRIIAQVWMPA